MTTATPKASINSGAWQYGAITESAPAVDLAVSDTVDLSRDATDGVNAERYEIYGWPPSFALPAGWTATEGVYRYSGATPPQFTLTHWGKYLIRLVLTTATGEVTSEALAMSITSDNGLEDIAPHEAGQFESWAIAIQDDLRILDPIIAITPPTGGTAYRITYSTAGDSTAWSTAVWSDGTYLGVGASVAAIPASGAIRLDDATAIAWKDNAGNDFDGLAHAYSGSKDRLQLGDATYVDLVQLFAAESVSVESVPLINPTYVAIGNDGTDPAAGLLRLNTYLVDQALLQVSDYYGTSLAVIDASHSATPAPVFTFGNANAEVFLTGTSIECSEKPLRAFYSAHSALDGGDDVAVPNDSSPHVIGSYTFSGTSGQVLLIEWIAYLSSGTSAGAKFAYHGRVLIQYGAPSSLTPSALITYLGGTPPPGLTISQAISGNDTLNVSATSTTTSFYGAAVEFWDQKPRTITSA